MAVHAHEVLCKTRRHSFTVSAVRIGVGGIDPCVRQGQTLKEEFESWVVAGCLQPEGSQVLEAIQSVNPEIQRSVALQPSKIPAKLQGVTTNYPRQLVLNLINGRKIA